MVLSDTEIDPSQCPFCGKELNSAGRGFMSHIENAADCDEEFEIWRSRVAEDIRGGWAG